MTVARKALVLQLSHGGTEAFSECVTDEVVSNTGEDNATALKTIKRVFAGGIRGDLPSPGEFLRSSRAIRGQPMAKAAIEMLLWDYKAKVEGEPLDRALGGPRGYAEVGIALGLGTPDQVISRIADAVDRGYQRIKVKVNRKKPVERLERIRDSFPEVPLSADANGCFELRKDLATLRRIDRFELQYLEQPLGYPDLLEHSRLAKEISTPICLDESVMTRRAAEQTIDLEAAKVINIKPGRVGGLTTALEIARIARDAGVHVWVGGVLETGIGRAFNIALASQKLVDLPGDTSPNDRYFARDLVKNPFMMRDGRIRPNKGDGIGIEIDPQFLSAVTARTWQNF